MELARDLAQYLGKPFDASEYRKQIGEKRRKGVLGRDYLANEGLIQTYIDHEDVAYLALFLASDETRRVTGHQY
ncbi:MAG: family oxidoreductase [Thermoproteota archaeon]|nr:family oxidoreductase [Thermoproteota archaeon]